MGDATTPQLAATSRSETLVEAFNSMVAEADASEQIPLDSDATRQEPRVRSAAHCARMAERYEAEAEDPRLSYVWRAALLQLAQSWRVCVTAASHVEA